MYLKALQGKAGGTIESAYTFRGTQYILYMSIFLQSDGECLPPHQIIPPIPILTLFPHPFPTQPPNITSLLHNPLSALIPPQLRSSPSSTPLYFPPLLPLILLYPVPINLRITTLRLPHLYTPPVFYSIPTLYFHESTPLYV